MQRQVAALGLPSALAARMVASTHAAAAAASAYLEIMPENWATVRTFIAMSTQWRRAGLSALPTALDYAALPGVLGMLGIAGDEDLLARLRRMESTAVRVMLDRAPR